MVCKFLDACVRWKCKSQNKTAAETKYCQLDNLSRVNPLHLTFLGDNKIFKCCGVFGGIAPSRMQHSVEKFLKIFPNTARTPIRIPNVGYPGATSVGNSILLSQHSLSKLETRILLGLALFSSLRIFFWIKISEDRNKYI